MGILKNSKTTFKDKDEAIERITGFIDSIEEPIPLRFLVSRFYPGLRKIGINASDFFSELEELEKCKVRMSQDGRSYFVYNIATYKLLKQVYSDGRYTVFHEQELMVAERNSKLRKKKQGKMPIVEG